MNKKQLAEKAYDKAIEDNKTIKEAEKIYMRIRKSRIAGDMEQT